MDRVTESLLRKFSAEFELTSLPESKQFEFFTTYSVVRQHYLETFDPADVVVGEDGDTGIDGIAIIVNNKLISDIDMFADRFDSENELDVSFIFVQSERSSSFDGAKIGNFSFGIQDFFKGREHSLARNQSVKTASSLYEAIYDRGADFRRGNPTCWIYYVTTGKWQDDPDLQSRCNAAVADIDRLGLFRRVEFVPVGASELQTYYRHTKDAIRTNFSFVTRSVIPGITGVKEAHLGFLPISEFIKILTDSNGELLVNLFDENVRGFLGTDNKINSAISGTLNSDYNDRFVLMNNGVTIIASKIQLTGNTFYIEDYQIVNGCQTSNIIYKNRDKLTDNVMVPLRLIGTTDEAVISSVIRATNKQSTVKEEQFLAIQDFSKELELHFSSFPDESRLYYERRSGQYSQLTIEKSKIVTQTSLIRAVAAMFLEEPHRVTRNYASIVIKAGKDFFRKSDKLDLYYIAAMCLYRIDFLLKTKKLEPKYRPARFHILLSIRILSNLEFLPRWNSNEMERECTSFMKVVSEVDQFEALVFQAAKVIDIVANGTYDDDVIRTEPFTRRVIKQSKQFKADAITV